jgi:hypothetical protein
LVFTYGTHRVWVTWYRLRLPHRNIKTRSLKVKKMAKKCPRYERPISYRKLNFPAQILHRKVLFMYVVCGLFWCTPTLGLFPPFFLLSEV